MSTEYDKLPIPDDWDKEANGYKLWFICVPNSSKWTSLFKSVVYELSRGRAYNINSGYVIGARDIGKEIFFSMQSCDLNTIARLLRQGIAAIVGEQVDLTDEAQIYPDNVDYRSVSSLPGLVPTLQALNLSPTTNITNRIEAGCGCGCEPGTETPPDQGIEIDPPPDGWITPIDPMTGLPIGTGSPAYNVRKCKAASLLHDEIRELFNQLNIYGVDNLIGLGASLVIGVVTTIISAQFTGPLSIFIGVISAVATFVFAFTSETFNLSTLIGLLDTHRDALICALYSATNADSAIASYTDILDAEGASFGMILSVEGVLTYATANTLFFQKDDATGDTVEDTINNYQGEDCSGCATCNFHHIPLGANVDNAFPEYIEFTTEITDNAVCNYGFANSSRAIISFVTEIPEDPCEQFGQNECFQGITVTAIRFISGTFVPLGSENHAYINHSGGQTGHTGFPGTDWEGSISNVSSIGVSGNASGTFTVRVEFA